jgi:hypothetical protein
VKDQQAIHAAVKRGRKSKELNKQAQGDDTKLLGQQGCQIKTVYYVKMV